MKSLRLFDFLLSQCLPFFLAFIAVGSFFYDDQSWFIRFTVFFVEVALTLFRPAWGFGAILLSCCWFEFPLILGQYPNQFLIETEIIGFLFVMAAIQSFFKRQKIFLEERSYLIDHPFFMPMIFATIVGLLQFTIALGELKVLSPFGIDYFKVLRTFFAEWFLWNVTGRVHGLSIAMGYLVLISLLYRVVRDQQILDFNEKRFIYYVCLGGAVVFVYALCQWFFPGYFWIENIRGISGTLQNGNHLSFFSAIILMSSSYGLFLLKSEQSRTKWFYATISLAAIVFLYKGQGKTAWLGLSFSFMVIMLFILSVRQAVLGGVAALLLFGGALVFWWSDIKQQGFVIDRLVLVRKGAELFSDNIFTGVGLGNFYQLAGEGYDMHNSYFSWTIEMGIAALVVILISSYRFIKQTIRLTKISQLFCFTFTGFIAATAFADHYLSYRSLAVLVALFFLLFCTKIPVNARLSAAKLKLPLFIFVSGLIIGGLSLFNPKTTVNLAKVEETDKLDLGESTLRGHLHAMISTWYVPPQSCIELPLAPIGKAGASVFRIGVIDGGLKANVSLKDLNGIEQKLEKAVLWNLFNGEINHLCLCLNSNFNCSHPLGCRVYIRSLRSQYIGWAKGFNSKDHRFFAYSSYTPEFYSIDQLKRSAGQQCHHLVEL